MAFDNFRFFSGLESNLPPATVDRIAEPAYTTDTKKFLICDGSSWNQVSGGGSGPSYVGDWNTLTPYTSGEIISYDGSSYVCTAPNSGSPPPNTMYWGVMAQRGATWWSGHGSPGVVVGSAVGDYYFNEDDGTVWVLG